MAQIRVVDATILATMPSVVRGILQIGLVLSLLGAASIFVRELIAFLGKRRPNNDLAQESRELDSLPGLAALESELE